MSKVRVAIALVFGAVIIAAGGFFAGASATSTSGWVNWIKFTSSGTQLCGHNRTSVNADRGPATVGWAAHERATSRSGSTCGSNHGRPYDYMRVYTSFFRNDVKIATDSAWNVEGGHVASTDIDYTGSGATQGCYRSNSVGRQYSNVIGGYYEPDGPTRSGEECKGIDT